MSLVKTTSNGKVIAKHLSGLAYQLSHEKPKQVRLAAARSINRTTTTIISKTTATLSRTEKLPKRFVKKRLLVPKRGRATSRFLNAKIHIYKSGIPWISLANNPKGAFQAGRVRFKGKKGSKTLVIGTRTGGRSIARGFVNVVGRKKRLHVLAREGKSRTPIQMPKIFIHDEANKLLNRRIARTFRLRYERELEGELKFRLTGNR